jgi:hypothetical protein
MSPRQPIDPASHAAMRTPGWYEDLSLMGLHLSADGANITAKPDAIACLFGRPSLYNFSLDLTPTTLLRLRHLLTYVDGHQHFPVNGHILAHDNTRRHTTRLIATAQQRPFPLLRLEVTTWCNDGNEAWLDTHLLENVTGGDIDHFQAVRAMWNAGINPLADAPLYVAAGFSPREARKLQDNATPAARRAQIDLLRALRAG